MQFSYQLFDCFLSPVTAVSISCIALSLLHSFQNLIVALSGFIFGSEIITRVGSKIASFQKIEKFEKEYEKVSTKRDKVLMFTPKSKYDSHKHYAESIEQAKTKE